MATEVTDPHWGRELEGKTCVIKVGGQWCGPCHAIEPIMKQVEDLGVELYKVNVDNNETLASQLGIRSIPTVIFIKNGEVIETIVGAVSSHRYLEAADKLLR